MKMALPKTKRPSGVITVHTSFPISLLKSEDHVADVKETTGSSGSRTSRRSKSSYLQVVSGQRHQVPSLCGPKNSHKQGRLSHTSIRQLQAKMEIENQQVQELLRPLLVRENGFMKELESFLTQRDVTELRRRELRHKRWTERVWFPLQRRVEERVSSCHLMEAKRRQNVHGHLLHSCDPKIKTAVSEEMLGLQLHEKTREKKAATSCRARSKNTCSKLQELPQTHRFSARLGCLWLTSFLRPSQIICCLLSPTFRKRMKPNKPNQVKRHHTIPHPFLIHTGSQRLLVVADQ